MAGVSKIYTSRGGHAMFTSASEFKRWDSIPYGRWTCADGREVLFNRFYEPLYQRRPGAQPTPANPNEWVQWTKQEWFYNDTASETKKRLAGKRALSEWGLA